jgi:hypothetical protein
MLLPLALAATVLASPPPVAMVAQLPKAALFQVSGTSDTSASQGFPGLSAPAAADERGWMGRLLDHLAVVKPHQQGRAQPPTLQMFVLVAPMKGQVGVHAVGSF